MMPCPRCGRAPVIKKVQIVEGLTGKAVSPPVYRYVCPEHEYDLRYATAPFATVEEASEAWDAGRFIGGGTA